MEPWDRLGAQVTCTDQAKIIPVLEESLKELDRQQGHHAEAGGSIRIVSLDWGQDGFAASEFHNEEVHYDVIVSAELVYLEETHDLLLWTWDRFCSPETTIYSVFINRPFSWNFFAIVHDSGLFEVQQLDEEKDFDPCGLEEVYIHVVTRKLKND
ncbi:EEF1AKMT3 [Symbiodinium sp. KB8]|nr:EEF1AKMT3 [Symbiodinium sp. KB8]